MGGDEGPRLVVQASLAYLNTHPEISISLVGQKSILNALIPGAILDGLNGRLRLINADQVVGMGEKAGEALRNKQQSSMWEAVRLLSEGEVDACVSAGNTGALMGIGRKLLGTCANVRRPAICKSIPTQTGASLLLDLGANLECSAEQLLQFGVMGAALARIYGISEPRVALLSVGTEASKGSEVMLSAAALMGQHTALNFTGFIEGLDLYAGKVDVVVCDGLIGNVALKVSEGFARFLLGHLREQSGLSLLERLGMFLAAPVYRRWLARFDPSRYNGAAFLGLRKTLVKSHGGATSDGFQQALTTAVEQVKERIPERIENSLQGAGVTF